MGLIALMLHHTAYSIPHTPYSIHTWVSRKPFVSLIRFEDSSLKHICYRKKENHKKDQLFLCRTPMMWYVGFFLFSMAVCLYAIFYTVGNVHIHNGIHSYERCWQVKPEMFFYIMRFWFCINVLQWNLNGFLKFALR